MPEPFDPNDPSEPVPYSRTRVAFRSDLSGRPIAIRPLEFLAKPGSERGRFLRMVDEVFDEMTLSDNRRADQIAEVRAGWFKYRVDPGTDVLRLVRGLRQRGIPAQANHVYFVSTVRAAAGGRLAVAPNMFTPNMFTPNMFTGGGAGGGGGSCFCPHGPVESDEEPTPRLGARPAQPPAGAAQPVPGKRVDVHVIDIATPGGGAANRVGEFNEQGFDLVEPAVNQNEDDWVDPATGHGDFVKSVLEEAAGVTATLWQAADPLGDISDSALVNALQAVQAAADRTKWRVLNLSLSGYNEDDRAGVVLADEIAEMLKDGWLIVAAAGNSASCRLAWPAALPGVVAVGAISRCVPAWFSNYGPWVDVSAPGVDIVARYPDIGKLGDDENKKPTDKLKVGPGKDAAGKMVMFLASDFDTGWATWSGTSFSAPFVAGKLAARLEAGVAVKQAAVARSEHVAAAVRALLSDDLDWLPYYGRILPA